MIELLDRGSLKYPSEIADQFVIMHEIFQKIDEHSHLSKIFYEILPSKIGSIGTSRC